MLQKSHFQFAKKFSFACLIAFSLFTSCKKDDVQTTFPTSGLDVVFYALTPGNQILKINAKTGSTINGTANITGLAAGARIISIDFRPATGQLYGLGNDSRLYSINPDNGNAVAIGSTPFSPAINGGIASIDFNPTVDRIRLVTNSGQNLRLNPETGTVVAIDGSISHPASLIPGITGIAYTNSKAGASTTTLYDIGVNFHQLYVQNPPNDGVVSDINPNALGIGFEGQVGFDINADNSIALASFNIPGSNTKLFTIDIANGTANFLVDLSTTVIDIAIPTQAVAYAVSETNSLLIFNPTAPQTVISKAITGLATGENILGIDMRPINGQLYALGSTSKLYTINASSGAASVVGTGFGTTFLSGTAFGFDFNPTVDRIRLVSNTGQNLRLNPIDGTVAATDLVINPVTPTLHAAAYTNNFAGATTTTLYVMNATTLFIQNPPNNGTLVSVGSLGITADVNGGFDIGSKSGTAYAIITVGTATKLYSINLTTGSATAVGDFSSKSRGFTLGLGF